MFLCPFCSLFAQQVNPEGKYVVDLDPSVDITKVTPNARVALRNDSYTLHKILPNKVRRAVVNSGLVRAW